MSMTPHEAQVAARAYEIWESEGRPHGRDVEHWSRAAAELTPLLAGAEPKLAAPPKPKKKAAQRSRKVAAAV